jgi:hypothetical protein
MAVSLRLVGGARAATAPALLQAGETRLEEQAMGRILLGVVIGIILVIWLLASCVGAIF